MKRNLLSLLVLLSVSTTLPAQEIYSEIRQHAQAKVNDPTAEVLVR